VPADVPASVPEDVETQVIDAALGVPPQDGLVEPGTADTEPGSPEAAPHVPIKRKGSRKR
jgi:ribonuclease E